jgi:uncharacterized integral membrane protein
MKKCNNCGNIIDDLYFHCPNCKSDNFEKIIEEPKEEVKEEKQENIWLPILLLILGIAVLGVGNFIFISLKMRGDNSVLPLIIYIVFVPIGLAMIMGPFIYRIKKKKNKR